MDGLPVRGSGGNGHPLRIFARGVRIESAEERSTRSRKRSDRFWNEHGPRTFVTRAMDGFGFGSAREALEKMVGVLKEMSRDTEDKLERCEKMAEQEVNQWKAKCEALEQERDELRMDVECAKRVAFDLKRKKDIYKRKYEEIKKELQGGSKGCKRIRAEENGREKEQVREARIRSTPGSGDGSASQEIDALVLHRCSTVERSTPEILDEGMGTARSAPGPLSLRLSELDDERENQAYEANVSQEFLDGRARVKEEGTRLPGTCAVPAGSGAPSLALARADPATHPREGGNDWTDPIEVLEDSPLESLPPTARGVDPYVDRSTPPGYKYAAVVRAREEREALPAHACAQCRGFYEALGEEVSMYACHHQASTDAPPPAAQGTSPFRQFVGRHRAYHAPPPTPTGYWDIGFGTPEDGAASSPCD